MREFDLGGLGGFLSEHFQAPRHQFCHADLAVKLSYIHETHNALGSSAGANFSKMV